MILIIKIKKKFKFKMSYNQERHLQLLKRSQDFKNQGRSFYTESPEECSELRIYNGFVEEHIFWEQRYQVEEFMQDFLNKKIDGEEFCDHVFGLRRNLGIASEKFLVQLVAGEVKDFQPDPRSEKLKGFFTGVYCYCDDFMEDYENDEFLSAMQNGFLNFQKALNEE
jgi:hypothetical protein